MRKVFVDASRRCMQNDDGLSLRVFATCGLMLTAWVAGLHGRACGGELRSPAPESWRREALLTDVQFVDAQRGWVCGERGTILKTTDGGLHWRAVPVPVDCRLDSISFVDLQHGWAVGGYEMPTSGRRVGVVLRTADGGETWQRMATPQLPWLHRVRFTDRLDGLAYGEVSTLQRSGIFLTRDGGRTWTTLTGFAPSGWVDGDTYDRASFSLVSSRQGMMWFDGNRFDAAPALDGRIPHFTRVKFSESGVGWAVGERGGVYRSHDRGRSWREALQVGAIPGLDQMQWRAIAVRGASVWVAGFPAGVVLHSHDDGANWEVTRTGFTGEMTALHFVDERFGWAVGSLGRIGVTEDGGFTWRFQRQGELQEFATLVVNDPKRVPYELLARVGGQDGWYLSILAPQVGQSTADINAVWSAGFESWNTAVGATGTRWWVPPHAGAFPAPRDAEERRLVNESLAMEQQQLDWRRRLVLELRACRPTVVMLPGPSRTNPLDGERRFYDLSLEAIAMAGDRRAYPEQLEVLGLQTFHPEKVVAWTAREGRGGARITSDEFALSLGRPLADFCLPSRVSTAPDTAMDPPHHAWQLIQSELPETVAGESLEGGIAQELLEHRRRLGSEDPRGTIQQVQRMAKVDDVHRSLVALAADEGGDPTGGAWLSQVDRQIADLDAWGAGNWLHRLALRHESANQSVAAMRAFRMVLDRYPDHPLSDDAALRLWRFYGSHEAARILDPQQASPFLSQGGEGDIETVGFESTLRTAAAEALAAADAEIAEAVAALDGAESSETSRSSEASSSLPSSDHESFDEGEEDSNSNRPEVHLPIFLFEGAAEAATNSGAVPTLPYADLDPSHVSAYLAALGGWLASDRPALHGDWRIRCAGALAPDQTSATQWQALAEYDPTLGAVAGAELWLAQPQVYPAPADRLEPEMVSEPPELDGQLDEASWVQSLESRRFLSLRSEDQSNAAATTVVLMRDDEFLYVGAICQKHADAAYPPNPGPRLRDERPEDVDHLVLWIDPDRDHQVSFSLRIDHRGRVWDGIGEDPTWNPQWFVAHRETDRTWVLEAAIPLQQLGAKPESVWWGLGVDRICPNLSTRSWGKVSAPDHQGERQGALIVGLVRMGSEEPAEGSEVEDRDPSKPLSGPESGQEPTGAPALENPMGSTPGAGSR